MVEVVLGQGHETRQHRQVVVVQGQQGVDRPGVVAGVESGVSGEHDCPGFRQGEVEDFRVVRVRGLVYEPLSPQPGQSLGHCALGDAQAFGQPGGGDAGLVADGFQGMGFSGEKRVPAAVVQRDTLQTMILVDDAEEGGLEFPDVVELGHGICLATKQASVNIPILGQEEVGGEAEGERRIQKRRRD